MASHFHLILTQRAYHNNLKLLAQLMCGQCDYNSIFVMVHLSDFTSERSCMLESVLNICQWLDHLPTFGCLEINLFVKNVKMVEMMIYFMGLNGKFTNRVHLNVYDVEFIPSDDNINIYIDCFPSHRNFAMCFGNERTLVLLSSINELPSLITQYNISKTAFDYLSEPQAMKIKLPV